MLVFLPILAFAFLTIAFHRKQNAWRVSFLFASIPWALFVAFSTEALSQFRLVTQAGVTFSWLVFAIACSVWAFKTPRVRKLELVTQKKALPWSERTALIVVALIAALIALTALASAPNNWDAMEYHLPRVFEWINNHGIQFYPTVDWSQLNQPPFAEYAMLHLELLWGSDRLLGLVQWFAYLGCVAGASLLAKELGGDRRAQILAVVFSATLPSAVLGASSTKNDCVAAYWIVLAAYLLLRWRRAQSWPLALAIGAALGLAAFSKGTAYVFLPCLVLACVLTWNTPERWRFLRRLPAIAALGALICMPLWVRNYRYSGSLFGLPYFYGVGDVNGRMFRTAQVSPSLIAANVVRNVALHAGVPNEQANTVSTGIFSTLIRGLGVDPNDRGQLVDSQLGYTPHFSVRFDPLNEVLSEEPLHLLLFLFAGAVLLLHRRRFENSVHWFGLGIVGAFFLYCALLRWSPWNARYQIPVFLLGMAFSAAVLAAVLPRRAIDAIAGLALLLALPLAFMNGTRPLVTRHGLTGSVLTTQRKRIYFFDAHRDLATSWIAAAAAVRASACRTIGIDANLLHFEYPMMAMLMEDNLPREVRYVGVENSSARYAQPSASPICMVICLGCLHYPEKFARYSVRLAKTQSFGTVVLFSRAE